MRAFQKYTWNGWNIVEAPEDIARELLTFGVHVYKTNSYPRLKTPKLIQEHTSKLLQRQKLEESHWRIYYFDTISDELRKALNAKCITRSPRPVVKFHPRQATAFMTKYLEKMLGDSFTKFQTIFEERSELTNEEIGISVIRTRVPEIKVVGYGEGKVYIAIKYKVKESPTIDLWKLDESALHSVIEIVKRQVDSQNLIRIKSPRAKGKVYSYLIRVLSGKTARTFLNALRDSSDVNRRDVYLKIEQSIHNIHPKMSPLDSNYVFIAVPPKKYSKTLFSLCKKSLLSWSCLNRTMVFTDLNTQLVVDPLVESLLFGEESDISQWKMDIVRRYDTVTSHFSKRLGFKRAHPDPIKVPDQKIIMVKTEKGVRYGWGVRGLLLDGNSKQAVFDDSIIPFTQRDENLRIFVYYPENIKSSLRNSLFEKRLESLANGIYTKAFTGGVEIIYRPIEGITWKSLSSLSPLDEYSHRILNDFEDNLGGHDDSHLVIPILPSQKGLVKFYNLRTKLLTEFDRKVAVQGIQTEGLKDSFRSYSSLLQTAPKLGVYLYTLDPKNPVVNGQGYDLLLGIDVTRRYEINQRSLAASVVLMTPEGIPKGAVVFPQDSEKESVDLLALFREILTSRTIRREIKEKNIGILLARDGFLTTMEIGSIENILLEFSNLELDMVEIVKEVGARVWLSKYSGPSYVTMPYGNITQYWVVAHKGMKLQNSSFVRPYSIRRYYHANDIESQLGPLTAPRSLVHYLIYLHKLNYTTYMDSVISLPAPVHFAHKCSNFIRQFGIEKIPIDNALFFV